MTIALHGTDEAVICAYQVLIPLAQEGCGLCCTMQRSNSHPLTPPPPPSKRSWLFLFKKSCKAVDKWCYIAPLGINAHLRKSHHVYYTFWALQNSQDRSETCHDSKNLGYFVGCWLRPKRYYKVLILPTAPRIASKQAAMWFSH